jgi:hypothetical protein
MAYTYSLNVIFLSQYVFEIAARKSALPADLQSALDARADRAAGLGPDGHPGPVVRRHQTTSRNLRAPP